MLSVIIPLYNKSKYIERCINSVIDTKIENIEIICIDDVSTDGSDLIAAAYENVRLIRNSQNKGAAYCRNIGINEAKGDFIIFLDADDYIIGSELEIVYSELKTMEAQGCIINLVDNDEVASISGEYKGCYKGKDLLAELVNNSDNFMYACGGIWSLKYLKENDIKFRDLIIGEGGLFILEALMKAERMLVSERGIYHYNVNSSSSCYRSDAMTLSAVGQLTQILFMIKRMIRDTDNRAIIAFLEDYIKKNIGGINNLTEKDLGKYFGDSTAEDLFIINLIKGKFINNPLKLSFSDEKLLKKYGRIYLYGAGYNTMDALRFCNEAGIVVEGIYVSDSSRNPLSLYGYKVQGFVENIEIDTDIPFLITARKKHHKEIVSILREAGVKIIVKVGE